jgi:hypothetical protein
MRRCFGDPVPIAFVLLENRGPQDFSDHFGSGRTRRSIARNGKRRSRIDPIAPDGTFVPGSVPVCWCDPHFNYYGIRALRDDCRKNFGRKAGCRPWSFLSAGRKNSFVSFGCV